MFGNDLVRSIQEEDGDIVDSLIFSRCCSSCRLCFFTTTQGDIYQHFFSLRYRGINIKIFFCTTCQCRYRQHRQKNRFHSHLFYLNINNSVTKKIPVHLFRISRRMRDPVRARSVIPIARFARLLSREVRDFFLFYLRPVTSTTATTTTRGIGHITYDKVAEHRCRAGFFQQDSTVAAELCAKRNAPY